MHRFNFSRLLLAVLGLALLGFGVAYGLKTLRGPSSAANPAAQSAQEQSPEASANAASAGEDSELREVSPAQLAKATQLPAVIQPAGRPAPSSVPPVARAQPTAYTRQLVAGLTNLDLSHGPITKEQADQWKQGLQALTQQGAAGVPAIREFLEQNQELNFAAINGGQLLEQPSLRAALINTLQQIGGPEATGVMLQTLQTTTLPSEIALLAKTLEQQAPGQYRAETVNSINEVLAMAEKGQLPGFDVGPLFQVLQNYGDAASAAALEQLQAQWKYYATMSLAGLPDGQGVSSLVHQAQDPAGGGKRDFAFEMLAQVATQYPDAGAALLEAARLNQIPDSTWRKIATGLTGDQYQLGAPPSAADVNAPPLPGLKTFHIASGNQNFYSLPVSTSASPDEIARRRAFIDQLLAANPSPAAIQALQTARSQLP